MTDYRRVSAEEMRERLGWPEPIPAGKKKPSLGSFATRFIAHSPFLVLATADAEGRADCSPRGDRPGFVIALDDRTLAIPDRPGNRLADSMSNLLQNPNIGLFFAVPGLSETVRVNGTAYVSDDPVLLQRLSSGGRPALFAIVVEIDEAFVHCGKAMVRSHLWEEESRRLGPLVTGGRSSAMVLAFAELELERGLAADEVEDMIGQDLRRV
ncbi:MSMEG_1061 family FMN-dependent PPOX-type flavoprotein [Herbiconiux sp. P15]|uniref:MSMEG_1061 family FMN-dependent PPOX-type flavoprotein n=1 Tax=Herbiconiux liukaitaii TaxID=3342799 RepID=UPI0035B9627B